MGNTTFASNTYDPIRGPDLYYRFRLEQRMPVDLHLVSTSPQWDAFLALASGPCGDLRHIPVLRTPRQNFIADDDQGGGPGAVGIRHGAVIAAAAQPA